MNDAAVFRPFIIKDKSRQHILLANSYSRGIFLYFFFRIFPLLLCSSIIVTIFTFNFPWFIHLSLVVILIIFIALMLQTYPSEIEVSETEIVLKKQTFLGKRVTTYAISEIEEIAVQTYWLYNGGGIYYYLILKNKHRKTSFFTIPYWYMNIKKREEINTIMEKYTGLKVVCG